jgi:hypothetical protein
MIPLINGVQYASANITVIIPLIGPISHGITEINFEKDQQIVDNYGFPQDPIGRAYGQNTYKADITLYKEIWNKIIDASPLRDPSKLPFADIIVVYGGAGIPFRKETLRAINFKNNPMGMKAGDTKILCKINLAVAGIDF